MRLSALVISSLIFISFQSNVFALGGTETPEKGNVPNCYIYKNYIVVLETGEYVGEIISVKTRKNKDDFDCSIQKNDSRVLTFDGSSGAESFEGIYKNFLFTDSGTGPDGRGIGIYDLNDTKRFYYAIYVFDNHSIENNQLFFYKVIEPKTKIKCPDEKKWRELGFDIGFEQETWFDLDSFKEKSIGEISCSPRQ